MVRRLLRARLHGLAICPPPASMAIPAAHGLMKVQPWAAGGAPRGPKPTLRGKRCAMMSLFSVCRAFTVRADRRWNGWKRARRIVSTCRIRFSAACMLMTSSLRSLPPLMVPRAFTTSLMICPRRRMMSSLMRATCCTAIGRRCNPSRRRAYRQWRVDFTPKTAGLRMAKRSGFYTGRHNIPIIGWV